MNLVEATLDGDDVVFGPVPRAAGSRSEAALWARSSGSSSEFARSRSKTRPSETTRPRSTVRVALLEEVGSDAYVFFQVDAPKITSEVLEASDEEALLLDATALFTARIDPRTRTRAGETLRLAVDPSRFHFFDAETGLRLAGRAEAMSAVAEEAPASAAG
jgi:ABC-type sugar transport system ATPase subunit